MIVLNKLNGYDKFYIKRKITTTAKKSFEADLY